MYDCVLKNIVNVPGDRIAFITETERITYSDILLLHKKNLRSIKCLNGAAIALRGQSRIAISLLVALLDGNVNRILFIPNDISDNLCARFYDDLNINFEVSLIDGSIKQVDVNINPNIKINDSHTQWIVPTSGTTNEPKLISHTFTTLTKSTIRNIENGNKFVWGLVYDINRFAGIQVLLQSLMSGSSLIVPESNFSIFRIIDLFNSYNCNAISATPSFWRKALMTNKVDILPLRRITLGGEIADKQILSALQEKFPNAKISHIYASTEIGVGFSVNDGKSGFPTSLLGKPLTNGARLAIKDGLLWINPGPKISLTNSDDFLCESGGFVNTGDLVEVVGDRVFFLGRSSGAINVGGNKVQPEEVERILLESGLLAAAYVYSKKSPIMGSLVCADIVPKMKVFNSIEFKRNIAKFCQQNLAAYKIPAIIKLVQDLNISQSGKLVRS